MPTNFTENYHLSQWEATDPVLREDFNADNLKIEEALNERNCCFINFSIAGLGEPRAGFTPYRQALMVFIIGDGHSLIMARPADKAVCYSATGQAALVNVEWTKRGLSWSAANGDPAFACNKADTEYSYSMILSME